MRIPRSPYDVAEQARLVSEFSNGLLGAYVVVMHSDVDELLVADPRYHRSLADCAQAMRGPAMTAVGLDVWHLARCEPPIDITTPVSLQRGWSWFNAALCKPAMIREPVSWSPGFHSIDAPVAFDHLYMFHLRYFDVERGLRRLAKTRSMPWATTYAGDHQRWPDQHWLELVQGIGALWPAEGDADVDREPLSSLLKKVVESQAGRENDTYKIDLTIQSHVRIPIPRRFRGRF